MSHTSHDHEPGGKGADSEALPLVTGQEAQLEQIQLQALGGHLAWQSELRNGRGGNGPQGYPRRQTVLLEGVKRSRGDTEAWVSSFYMKTLWQKSRVQ